MIAYQSQMLPNVNSQDLEEDFTFSISELEYSTMQDCCDFLEVLKLVVLQ